MFRNAFCARAVVLGQPGRAADRQYCHNNGMMGWPTAASRSTTTTSTSSGRCAPPATHRADRRAARLGATGHPRLRHRPRRPGHDRQLGRAGGDRGAGRDIPVRRSSCRSGSSRRTAASSPRARSATASTRCRRRSCPTRQRSGPTSRPTRQAPARSITASGRAEHAARDRPGPQHAGDLHDRPRARLPHREGEPARPRHRRDDDHARAGIRRWRRARRAGLAHRRLPDALRGGRHRPAAVAGGRSLLRSSPATSRRPAHRDLLRADLPRRLRAPARDPDRALQVRPPLRRLPVSRSCPTATTARARTPTSPAGGRSGRSPREALHDLFFNPGEGRNVVDDPAYAESRRTCAPAAAMDDCDRRIRCSTGPSRRRPARGSTPRISCRRRSRRSSRSSQPRRRPQARDGLTRGRRIRSQRHRSAWPGAGGGRRQTPDGFWLLSPAIDSSLERGRYPAAGVSRARALRRFAASARRRRPASS